MSTEPFRILFITGEYPPMQGGVADYTRELGRALVELGHDVGVLTSVDATKGWVEPGIEVFPRIDGWGWNVWSELDRMVKDWQPDVVHIQYQTAAYGMHPAVNLWSWRPGKTCRLRLLSLSTICWSPFSSPRRTGSVCAAG